MCAEMYRYFIYDVSILLKPAIQHVLLLQGRLENKHKFLLIFSHVYETMKGMRSHPFRGILQFSHTYFEMIG